MTDEENSDLEEEAVAEPMRQLATIQKVVSLSPIPGKDRIEMARILGYDAIVKKGEFAPGDLCVYIETDSMVPVAKEMFKFLSSRAKLVDGQPMARIQVLKLGEAYSHGLALPVSALLLGRTVSEGDDVADYLGVTKYTGKIKKKGARNATSDGAPGMKFGGSLAWPEFAPSKTDEVRLQSRPLLMEELRDTPVYVTIKVDGTSCTAIRRTPDEFVVCSRNGEKRVRTDKTCPKCKGSVATEMNDPLCEVCLGSGVLEIEMDGFNRAMRELGVFDRLAPGYAIQGELAGPGIQGNPSRLTEKHFFIFNVFRYVEGDARPHLLDFNEASRLVEAWELEFAPLLIGPVQLRADTDLETMKGWANGLMYNGQIAEGIVIRPVVPRVSEVRGVGRMSAKIINAEYELKT